MSLDLPSLRGIRPRKFGLVSWSNHVPFAFDLVAAVRPRLLVELGTHSGESYFAFCQSASENGTGTSCYAVDTWQGDEQAGFYDESVYEEVFVHNQEFYAAFSYLVRGTFDDAKAQFADGSIDLLHIDGLHTYEAVRHDYENWLPKVADHGIILFHDIAARHGDFGAWRLWEELTTAAGPGGSFTFQHGWGLGVLRKRPDLPLPEQGNEALRALFGADPAGAENIRRYYRLAADSLRAHPVPDAPPAPLPSSAAVATLAASPKATRPAGATAKKNPRLQVYFPRPDGSYAESESARLEVETGRWTRLTVPLPEGWAGGRLRVDPLHGQGLAELAEARVVSRVFGGDGGGGKAGVLWECRGAEELERDVQLAGTALRVPSGRFLRLFSTGGDPQFHLPVLDPGEFDEPLQLELTLRVHLDWSTLAGPMRLWARTLQDVPAERAVTARLREALDTRIAELGAAVAATQRTEGLLAARDSELALAQSTLAEREHRLATTDAELARMRDKAEDLQLQADAYRIEEQRRRTELSEVQEAHGALAALLSTRDAQLADHQAELADRQAELARHQAELADRHAAVDAAGQLLEDARTQLAEVRAELARARAEGEDARRQAIDLHAEEQRRRAELTEVQEAHRALAETLAARDAALEAVRARLADAEEENRQTRTRITEVEAEARDAGLRFDIADAEVQGLRAELAAASGDLAAARGEGEDLRDRLAAAAAEWTVLRERWHTDEGRVRTMRDSLSWRLTLPLRAVGRVMGKPSSTDPATDGKPQDTPKWMAKNFAPPAAPSKAEPAPPFHVHLDEPGNWNLPARQVRLVGWCVPSVRMFPAEAKKNGRSGPPTTTATAPAAAPGPLRSVRVRGGETEFTGRASILRTDVAAHYGLAAEDHRCGFEVLLDLHGGPSTLHLEGIDEAGTVWPLGRFEARAPYSTHPLPGAAGAVLIDPATDYDAWVRRFDTLSAEDRGRLREGADRLPWKPLISVLMPTFNTPTRWLERAIESVRAQLYPHWELCVADDASTSLETRMTLERYARLDGRVRVVFRPENGHISAASNSALELAKGEFVALLDHDDELPVHALLAVATDLNGHPETDLLFSDEDKIDEDGRRFDPYFKPDWNPDLLTGQNCVSHLGVFRTARMREVGGFRVGFEGCQDWDLALRVSEILPPGRIRHLPRVLYHWRAIAGSTARAVEEKDYVVDSAERTVREHCERTGKTTLVQRATAGHLRVRYPVPDPAPLVTIIIPTRDQLALLRHGLESLWIRTTYLNYEILVIDNGSVEPETLDFLRISEAAGRLRVLRDERPFNYSALNNRAVAEAHGELVCLFNNDLEVLTPDWLEEMVGQALRPGIGAVGAMLLYPEDTIQHAGVVLGLGGVAGHVFSRLPRGAPGYFNRARLAQNLTAVTAACLVVRKGLYEQVGGLDEKQLAIAFNDVDFCLKLRAAGFHNLWTPFAEFYHHESASRGAEDTPAKHRRFAAEVEHMRVRWEEVIARDPAYNPNLTLEHGDCRRACPPRLPPLAEALLAGVPPAPDDATLLARVVSVENGKELTGTVARAK